MCVIYIYIYIYIHVYIHTHTSIVISYRILCCARGALAALPPAQHGANYIILYRILV